MCIPRRVFYGAVVHLLWVRFEVFCCVVASQAKIDQVCLTAATLAIAQQHISALQVGMHVCTSMDVLVHVQLGRNSINVSMQLLPEYSYHLYGQSEHRM